MPETMTKIFATFSLSLVFSLILTPLVVRVAKKYHLVDMPSARKGLHSVGLTTLHIE